MTLAPDQAELTWAAPSSNGGAAIDSYVINLYRYSSKANFWGYVSSVESCGACTAARVVGLSPDTYYGFGLYAHNSQGFSPPAATSIDGLLNDGATDPYPGLPETVGGNGSITVSWATPYAAAAYGQGKLYYGVTLVPSDNSATLGPYDTTALSLTVTGLTNGKAYLAEVTAYYPTLCACSINSGYALVGAPPPDALMGAGDRSFFSYDTYKVSDQTAAKVNIGSGDLLVNQHDATLPGVAGGYSVGQDFNSLALSPSASLNTDGGGTGVLAGRQIPDLSPGWRFDTGSDVFLAIGAATVTYYDRSGGAWTFTQVGSAWNPPPGLNATMTHDPTSGGWTVADHQSNEILSFDGSGAPTADIDRNGNTVVFSNDNPDSSYYGQIGSSVRITSSAGYT
ncbi:MAG: fibronectin type III domain-containing protein, partial [Mycobacteriales bacterium]